MATTMLEATLGEYAGYGFQLKEYADHIVELHFKEKLIAYFTQDVTVGPIRATCQRYLNELNGGEKYVSM